MALYLLPANYLTSQTPLTASSQAPAILGQGVDARTSGTATLITRGTYTGTTDRHYRVIIVNATPGAETFIWNTDLEPTFSAEQSAVSSVWYTLSFGIQVMFVPGAAPPQVGTADEWRFAAFRTYPVANLIDQNRDTEFRTGAISAGAGFNVDVDFVVARQPLALVLDDHTIPSGSGIFLNASANANFSPLSVNQAIPWAAGRILYVISGVHTYRYWRLVVNNLPAAVPYVRASEWYLGGLYTMSQMFRIEPVYREQVVGQSPETVLMRGPGARPFRPKRYQLEFTGLQASVAGDLLNLRNTWALIHESGQKPFYVYFNTVAGMEIFELVHWLGDFDQEHLFFDRVDVPVEWVSLIRTAA